METDAFPQSGCPRLTQLERVVVTAEQMAAIESRVFAAGMPVAALMEKVAGLTVQRVIAQVGAAPRRIGVLVGPGHNGGDALVIARELHLQGYRVQCWQPIAQLKALTEQHARYVASLGIPIVDSAQALADCDAWVDGLFGVGLTRSLSDDLATAIHQLNGWSTAARPIVSIDLPSGLHTDTGTVLGAAVQATHTLCLGLWKRGLFREQALAYVGQAELVDFGLPLADVAAVLGDLRELAVQRITPQGAIAALPIPRAITAHKYQVGHLLLVCGSRQYPGAALLSAKAAQASGVGMLTVAVPESLMHLVVAQVPGAVVLGCSETAEGAIAHLPHDLDLSRYQAIACGPGLTRAAHAALDQAIASSVPLVLDADGLNLLADLGLDAVRSRRAPTLLTPHLGEFRRLFPDLAERLANDHLELAIAAADQSNCIVLLKGARMAIATPQGRLWLNPQSTPALARGGSGDVLTGLLGGLLAQGQQRNTAPELSAQAAVWCHAQAGIHAAATRGELGVDALTLAESLPHVWQTLL
ncbi:MAG: NAD(P)H-hydrate dehydratase [Kaiparowitsia implicata GSE-PSE-MK54-09C]|jgi:NAD(P)H-hydrate epimerase|nr:NAD(P)H-hydrate dehydratase [Kaiparowitsia implicata GSE-PSE-MK54-09C]